MSPVLIVLVVLLVVFGAPPLYRRATRPPRVATAVIVDPENHTTMDAQGAVRSAQAADLEMPEDALEAIWTPLHLERLARTYWRYLTRCTGGIIRVRYRPDGRDVCLFGLRPLTLLSFHAPEYELESDHGRVSWPIAKGLLVSPRGRGGNGYLDIEVRRRPGNRDGYSVAHVEVEVANFYPAIAWALSRFVYTNTQSRIHVIVTHGFLRSLARLDLAESRVGHFTERGPEPAE
jgi:hypothetical protein